MRKTVLFFFGIILISSCSSIKEDCKCEGKFKRINNSGSGYFLATGVDCLTGQPTLDQQNQGPLGTTNPAIYLGCNK